MEKTDPQLQQDDGASGRTASADDRLSALSALLSNLDEAAHADVHHAQEDAYQQQLVQVRLGMASSLYTALRAKHLGTASHCLRVALGVSSWCMAMELEERERDLFEIAALLHDVGKIGVPDHVLAKPGKLCGEELLAMEQHRQYGREILRGCCDSTELLDIVFYCSAWYDGSRHGFDRQGDALPLGSRVIAIVDAFDAMTTDHVYRPAWSRDRALAELFSGAGSQFDPALVHRFSEQLSGERVPFDRRVARRWLRQITVDQSQSFWTLGDPPGSCGRDPINRAFHDRLIASMHDGVVFVDQHANITKWNRAAERLTGISANAVMGSQWNPSLFELRDERGRLLADEECPLAQTIASGTQTLRRLSVKHHDHEKVSLDVHITPVLGSDGTTRGATMLLRDASSQITLEERLQSLHERATRDPLTKCANRAEFDRVLPQFVRTHLEEGLPCSMIISDIDHFKKINDTYGHQVGDEALASFGNHLRRHARGGDQVARYGGEEFVILCHDCTNATATQRAEQMRSELAAAAQPSLKNEAITASFGVTEIQPGDTPETFFRRADRALLQAKDNGRNIVVQLGTGIGDAGAAPAFRQNWLNWLRGGQQESLLERSLVTVVPLRVAAEKLRGFVADHHADLLEIQDNRVALKLDGPNMPMVRRWNDRPVPFLIELTFEERELPSENNRSQSSQQRTIVHVVIRPKRQRDRRRRDAMQRARQLLVSLKSYLMAHDHTNSRSVGVNPPPHSFMENARRILSYWLRA